MTQTGASVEGTRVQSNTKPDTLRKTITVAAPREVAFRVFTQGMTTWWPLATHKIGKAPAVQAVLEPRVGGRWYEKGDDGSECDGGRVLAWDPPAGLSLDWQIDRQWQYDPRSTPKSWCDSSRRTRRGRGWSWSTGTSTASACTATRLSQRSTRRAAGRISSRRLRPRRPRRTERRAPALARLEPGRPLRPGSSEPPPRGSAQRSPGVAPRCWG